MAAGHLNTALHESTRHLVEGPSRDTVCARAHSLVLPKTCCNWAHRKADVQHCDRETH